MHVKHTIDCPSSLTAILLQQLAGHIVKTGKIPAETDELSKKTCEAWISVITKDHSVDKILR